MENDPMAKSMFERYGGFASVSRVVSSFYDKAIASPVLSPYFEAVDMRKLIDHQTKFVASVMGGPASYSDDELTRVHRNLDITAAAFNEMTTLMEETLEDFEYDPGDIRAVMSAIRNRRRCIVMED
jgi:hemoglobin